MRLNKQKVMNICLVLQQLNYSMKITKKNVIKNLLERFSCSIVKRGKKVSGHKILLRSLFLIREKKEKDLQVISLSGLQNKVNTIKQNTFCLSSTATRTTGSVVSVVSVARQVGSRPSPALPGQKLQPNLESGSLPSAENGERGFKRFNSSDEQVRTNQRLRFTVQDSLLSQIKSFKNESEREKRFSLQKEKDNTKQKRYTSLPQYVWRVNDFSYFSSSQAKKKHNKSKKIMTFVNKNNQICQRCVDNVKVVLETRKVRKGRVTHKVPIITNPRRQEGKAIALLIKNSSDNFLSLPGKSNQLKQSKEFVPDSLLSFSQKVIKKQSNSANKLSWFSDIVFYSQKKNGLDSIKHGLAKEFFHSANLEGVSVENKKQLHNFALQNRASLHFRWW